MIVVSYVIVEYNVETKADTQQRRSILRHRRKLRHRCILRQACRRIQRYRCFLRQRSILLLYLTVSGVGYSILD